MVVRQFNSAYLGVLCDSAVNTFAPHFTAEPQRTQRYAEKFLKVLHYGNHAFPE